MGMYTGLRCRVKIKEEFIKVVKHVIETDNWNSWEDAHNKFGFGFLKQFSEASRCNMIPFGSLSYMPDEWDEYSNERTKLFIEGLNEETRIWSFQCSLKNYDSTISKFIEIILNNIVEEIDELEDFYEECTHSNKYVLKDGNIVGSEEVGYKYEEDYY